MGNVNAKMKGPGYQNKMYDSFRPSQAAKPKKTVKKKKEKLLKDTPRGSNLSKVGRSKTGRFEKK